MKSLVLHLRGGVEEWLPRPWIAACGCLLIVCWLLMAAGELLLVSDAYLLAVDAGNGILFSSIGFLSVLCAFASFYLIKRPSDKR